MIIVFEDGDELRPDDFGLEYFEQQLQNPRMSCLVLSNEAYIRLQKNKRTHIDH